jgi:endonuclease/exonuclease/phosphatase family metal-dependent hydrolase
MAGGATQRGGAEPSALKPPFAPIIVNRPPRLVPGPLRVTLFNARGGADLEKIGDCLSRPPLGQSSLMLLCESDWGTKRSRQREVAAELARRLNMSFAYVPEFGIPQADGTHKSFLGNAILSTVPLNEVRAVALPRPLPELRKMRHHVGLKTGLITTARFGHRDVTVGVVHLTSHCDPEARDKQMATYLAAFPKGGPAIIGGDLNTTTTVLQTRAIRPDDVRRAMLNWWRELLRICVLVALRPSRFHWPQPYEPLFKRLSTAGLKIDEVNVMGKPTFTFSRAIPPRYRPKLDWFAVRELQAIPGSAAVLPPRRSVFSARLSDHDFVTVELDL